MLHSGDRTFYKATVERHDGLSWLCNDDDDETVTATSAVCTAKSALVTDWFCILGICLSISRKFPFGKFFSREREKFSGPGKFGSR